MMVEYGVHKVTAQDVELLIRRFAKGGREGKVNF
jgi:hypothetical protein